jgi:hypothetical protein
MRYRIRTLLILLAILPPLLAVGWWKYSEWRAAVDRHREMRADSLRQAAIKDAYRVDREKALRKQMLIEQLIEKNRQKARDLGEIPCAG